MTATESGINNLPQVVSLIIFAMGAGMYTTKTGTYRLIPAIGLALTTVGLGLFTVWDLDTGKAMEFVPQIIAGAGTGFIINSAQMIAQTSSPAHLNGPGTTVANFIRLLGGVIGIAAFQTVFSNVLKTKLAGYLVFVAAQYQLPAADIMLYSDYLNTRFSAHRADVSSIPADALSALNTAYLQANVDGLHVSFISAAIVVGIGIFFGVWIKHVPLKKEVQVVIRTEE
ncbi:hypothetical protein HDU93_005477 [Gonapodya sp. JEL0774]|nr:hypothetical protein HDU93_005477 [Gonapodya sp. JEL0774]